MQRSEASGKLHIIGGVVDRTGDRAILSSSCAMPEGRQSRCRHCMAK
ncbi:MAG TPA: hypothetical protein VGC89_15790 [Pyrinomonadaceae bacterium]